jgi:predicted regulator of Ras-like GTPase activity (Roadblock/LC7/MglB family)
MGFDGVAVESFAGAGEADVQAMGMEFAFVLNQVRKAAQILEVGALRELTVHGDRLIFLIQVLGEEYFVGLAMRPDSNFGKARFLLRLALPDLKNPV